MAVNFRHDSVTVPAYDFGMSATLVGLPRPSDPPESPSGALLNRELQWLRFDERVLEEAENPQHPLLERVKFLTIFANNLDEFFMVRVSGLKSQLESAAPALSDDGLTPAQQLTAIREMLIPLLDRAERLWTGTLAPALALEGIRIRPLAELDAVTLARLDERFEREIFPVLTPLAIDPGHPFPYISTLSLNLLLSLRDPAQPEAQPRRGRIKIPTLIPRLLPLDEGGCEFADLVELIVRHLPRLFPGLRVERQLLFRVTRDADLEIDEDEAEDLLKSVERELKQRRFGAAVRMDLERGGDPEMGDFLRRHLELEPADVYDRHGFLPLTDLSGLIRAPRPGLKDPPFLPRVPAAIAQAPDLFAAIREGDLLLHHPYDSFNPVSEFIEAAAIDPGVLAIKMTLYRIGARSPILPALMRAVEQGKQVAVLIELRARFDEEVNIEWAKKLERAGVHVVYGLHGVKTHAKVALVVRREGETLRRYVHLGTGNYNPLTARVYTDFGFFTCREPFAADATELFNALTGAGRIPALRKLVTAPDGMRGWALAAIGEELRAHLGGRAAGIVLKMNSLVDPEVIAALQSAGRAGLPIRLIVRGVCCLRPTPEDGIEVRSVVGRLLEHSRVFDFVNGGVWLSSADWMPRNFDSRVECAWPVEEPALAARIRAALAAYLADDRRARLLRPDGSYQRPGAGEKSAQEQLLAGE